ncbi:hypothetical protein [Butyrivibrio sp. LC3010]|uniref:hypothetical protein n=1 Tax=Butyrivibrio sp. LC3010 TaxID=1280680 RepID=UPI000411C03D|nr:hypothetical protein [Butyrivibrio sp. LC3010]
MKKALVQKNEIIVLLGVYLAIVALLNFSLRYVFCPVYGDILLYTDEARSLADSGTFKFANTYGTSGAYVYPFIISFIYKYFYNSYNIVDMTRFLGIVLMTTTIFPAYLLLGKMKIFGRKRVILSIASVVIPDMLQSWLQVTEVIAYPLFIWTLLLFYIDIEQKDKLITTVGMALICFLDYLTRGQYLVIGLAYICTLSIFVLQELLSKGKPAVFLKKLGVFLVLFAGLYIAVPKVLTQLHVIADTEDMGGSFLSESIQKILENPSYFLVQWGKGFFWYAFFISLAFGFVTVLVPAFYRSYEDEICNRLVVFVNAIFLLTLAIVVLIIYSMEEPLEYDTHRIHQRYFFFLFTPYLYLFYRIDFSRFKFGKIRTLIMAIFMIFIAFGRFIFQLRENFYLGVESIALTAFRIAKEKITIEPRLEYVYTIGTLLFLGIVFTLIKAKGWVNFSRIIYPVLFVVIIAFNTKIYTDRQIYITDTAMHDYSNRYGHAADFLKDFNTGEVVAIINELCIDSEIQTFQVVNKKCLDVISIAELDALYEETPGKLNIREFDRLGYFYYKPDKHRVLSDANYVVVRRGYLKNKYKIQNEKVYKDDYFVIYKLDDGYLNVNKVE